MMKDPTAGDVATGLHGAASEDSYSLIVHRSKDVSILDRPARGSRSPADAGISTVCKVSAGSVPKRDTISTPVASSHELMGLNGLPAGTFRDTPSLQLVPHVQSGRGWGSNHELRCQRAEY